jgi:hypothetical protein
MYFAIVMDAEFSPHLEAAIFEVVENQIANNTPPVDILRVTG